MMLKIGRQACWIVLIAALLLSGNALGYNVNNPADDKNDGKDCEHECEECCDTSGSTGEASVKNCASLMAKFFLGRGANGSKLGPGCLMIHAESMSSMLATPQKLVYSKDRRGFTVDQNGSVVVPMRSGQYHTYAPQPSTSMMKPKGGSQESRMRLVKTDPSLCVQPPDSGNSPAYYRLDYPYGLKEYFGTNGIAYIENAAGQLYTTADLGVDAVRVDGILRQIRTPQCLADIVTLGSYGYRIDYYRPFNVGPKGDILYQTFGNPFVSWKIEYLGGYLTMKKMRGGTALDTYHCTYSDQNSRWTIERIDDDLNYALGTNEDGVMYAETKYLSWDSNEFNYRTDTTEVVDGSSHVSSRKTEIIRRYPWGDTTEAEYAGDVMTVSNTYYTSSSQANTYGQLEKVIRTGGCRSCGGGKSGWEWYKSYDAYSRRTEVWKSFRDVAIDSATDSNCQVYEYTYSTNDVADVRPRSIVRKIEGQIVEKSWHDYYTTNGLSVEVTEKATSPTASQGDASNSKTITKYYITSSGSDPSAGQLASRQYPDGRLDTHSYTSGYVTGSGSSAEFHVNSSSNCWHKTVIHGVTGTPSDIEGKTTMETTVMDDKGRTIITKRYVYRDSGYTNNCIDWAFHSYASDADGYARTNTVEYADGTTETTEYAGNRKTARTDRDGTRYEFTYTGDWIAIRTRKGEGSQPDLVTSYQYNAAGKATNETVSASGHGITQSSSREYDLAKRITKSVDPAGLANLWTYAEDGLSTTNTLPGGATRVETDYECAFHKSVTGTGVIDQYYDVGPNSDGTRWETTHTAADDGPRWARTIKDMLGRTIRSEQPAFGGATNETVYTYNSQGRVEKTETTGQPDTLYAYDELGNRVATCVDADDDGWSSTSNRISSNSTVIVTNANSELVRETKSYVYAQDGTNTATLVSTRREWMPVELGGSAPSPYSGVLTAKSSSTDIHGNTTWQYTYTDAANKTVVRVVDSPDSDTDAVTTTVNGLVTEQTSRTDVTTEYAYDALGRRTGSATESDGGARSTGTTIGYNSKGQVAWTMDAASNTTYYAYDDSTGRRTAVTNAVNDVTYTDYDLLGNLTNTWGATYPVAYEYDDYGQMSKMMTWRDENGSPDETEWQYDAATGVLTNKVYADSNGTAYDYYPDGQLKTRTWARGETTDYSYDSLNQLTNVAYSATNDTPNVSYNYDRLGRQLEIVDGQGTHSFAYDASTLALTNETVIANGVTNSIARSYDSYGRSDGFAFGSYDVDYGFDSAGRFATLVATNGSVAVANVDYNYISGSDLISGRTNAVPGLGVSRSYETNRDLLTQVHNQSGGTTVSKFEYQNDALGRRTERLDTYSGVVTNSFGYNARSEVTNAVMGADSYAWGYDPIGNREFFTENGTTLDYLANQLNQYTNIANGVTNTPSYDSDGNMTNYNGWAYQWNGENRLRVASDGSTSVTNKYDYMGRRIGKSVDGVETEFLYDGWNLVQETTGTNVTRYVWGLDLSQSLQGAGGVGGLLCVIENGEEYYPAYDANGNITEYVDSTGTNVVAHYEYSAFGKITASSGTKADDFKFRFSTKYYDTETGLVYYGYRYYNPGLGRWINRDPIGERGGINLYTFVSNSSIHLVDRLGQKVDDWPWDAIISLYWRIVAEVNRHKFIKKTLIYDVECPDGYSKVLLSRSRRIKYVEQELDANIMLLDILAFFGVDDKYKEIPIIIPPGRIIQPGNGFPGQNIISREYKMDITEKHYGCCCKRGSFLWSYHRSKDKKEYIEKRNLLGVRIVYSVREEDKFSQWARMCAEREGNPTRTWIREE